MTVWWHFNPGTGWHRHNTKAEAMDAALTDLRAHADYAASDGWCEGIEQLSVWKTKQATPTEEAYCGWVEDHGEKVAETVQCFEDTRPSVPDDIPDDEVEDWKTDNWAVDWDFPTVGNYELREMGKGE